MSDAGTQDLTFRIKMEAQISDAWNAFNKSVGESGKKAKEAGGSLAELVSAAKEAGESVAGLWAQAEVSREALAEFSEFQDALTRIGRAAVMTKEQVGEFGEELGKLASSQGKSAEGQLLAIAQAAAQVNVSKQNLASFTETVNDLGLAANGAGAQYATMLGQILNVTEGGSERSKQFGNEIAELSAKTGTTTQTLVSYARAIASMTGAYQISSQEVLALSDVLQRVPALAARGVTSTAGVFNTIFGTIRQQTQSVRDALSELAADSGKTFEEMQGLARNDPLRVVEDILVHVNKLNAAGKDPHNFLRQFGADGDNAERVLKEIAPHIGDIQKNLEAINKAPGDASKKYGEETAKNFSEVMQRTRNVVNETFKNLGTEISGPVIKGAEELAKPFELINSMFEKLGQLDKEGNHLPKLFVDMAVQAAFVGVALGSITKAFPKIQEAGEAAFAYLGASEKKALEGTELKSAADEKAVVSATRLAEANTVLAASNEKVAATSLAAAEAGGASRGLAVAGVAGAGAAAGVAAKAAEESAAKKAGELAVENALKNDLATKLSLGATLGAGARAGIAGAAGFVGKTAPPLLIADALFGPFAEYTDKKARELRGHEGEDQPKQETYAGTFDQFEAALDKLNPSLGRFDNWLGTITGKYLPVAIGLTDEAQKRALAGKDAYESPLTAEQKAAQDKVHEKVGKSEAGGLEDVKSELAKAAKDSSSLTDADKEAFKKTGDLRAVGLTAQDTQLQGSLSPLFEMQRQIKDLKTAFEHTVSLDKDQPNSERRFNSDERAQAQENITLAERRLHPVQEQLRVQALALDLQAQTNARAKEEIEIRQAIAAAIEKDGSVKNHPEVQEEVAAGVRRKNFVETQNALEMSNRELDQSIEKQIQLNSYAAAEVEIQQKIATFRREHNVSDNDPQLKAYQQRLEAERNVSDTKGLENQYLPQQAALMQEIGSLQRVDALQKAGLINDQTALQLKQQIALAAEKEVSPLQSMARDYQLQLQSLQVTGQYRDADLKTLQQLNDLEQRGIVNAQNKNAVYEQLKQTNRDILELQKEQNEGFNGFVNKVGSLQDNLRGAEGDLAQGLSSAIAEGITGGGAQGFQQLGKQLAARAVNMILADVFKATGLASTDQKQVDKVQKDILGLQKLGIAQANITIGTATINGLNLTKAVGDLPKIENPASVEGAANTVANTAAAAAGPNASGVAQTAEQLSMAAGLKALGAKSIAAPATPISPTVSTAPRGKVSVSDGNEPIPSGAVAANADGSITLPGETVAPHATSTAPGLPSLPATPAPSPSPAPVHTGAPTPLGSSPFGDLGGATSVFGPKPAQTGAGSIPADVHGADLSKYFPNTIQGRAAMDRFIAQREGVNPELATAISHNEGNNAYALGPNQTTRTDIDASGKPFTFGDYQLNFHPGQIGDTFRKNYGLDPSKPTFYAESDELAIKYMAGHLPESKNLSPKQRFDPWNGDRGYEAWKANGRPGGYYQKPDANPPNPLVKSNQDTYNQNVQPLGDARPPAGMINSSANDEFFSRFAGGPNVHTAGFNGEFSTGLQGFLKQAEAQGLHPRIESGFRTRQDQEELYANYLAGKQGKPLPYPERGPVSVAAKPGQSPHEFGTAADVHTDDVMKADAIARENHLKAGSDFGDPGHYELLKKDPQALADPLAEYRQFNALADEEKQILGGNKQDFLKGLGGGVEQAQGLVGSLGGGAGGGAAKSPFGELSAKPDFAVWPNTGDEVRSYMDSRTKGFGELDPNFKAAPGTASGDLPEMVHYPHYDYKAPVPAQYRTNVPAQPNELSQLGSSPYGANVPGTLTPPPGSTSNFFQPTPVGGAATGSLYHPEFTIPKSNPIAGQSADLNLNPNAPQFSPLGNSSLPAVHAAALPHPELTIPKSNLAGFPDDAGAPITTGPEAPRPQYDPSVLDHRSVAEIQAAEAAKRAQFDKEWKATQEHMETTHKAELPKAATEPVAYRPTPVGSDTARALPQQPPSSLQPFPAQTGFVDPRYPNLPRTYGGMPVNDGFNGQAPGTEPWHTPSGPNAAQFDPRWKGFSALEEGGFGQHMNPSVPLASLTHELSKEVPKVGEGIGTLSGTLGSGAQGVQSHLQELMSALSAKGSGGGGGGGGGLGGLFGGGGGGGFGGGGADFSSLDVGDFGDTVDFSGIESFHTGGLVGGTAARALINVNPTVFNTAPRFHTGLQTDEFPAILQRGERVLTQGDATRVDTVLSRAGDMANSGQTVKRGGGQNVHNYFNISTPDANSFRAHSGQIAARSSLAMQRATDRNT